MRTTASSSNDDGDIASIFDKQTRQRIALRSGAPRHLVRQSRAVAGLEHGLGARSRLRRRLTCRGPAKIRIVENGPARVAHRGHAGNGGLAIRRRRSGSLRGTQESASSSATSIDWNTRESNLKAVFPLTALNEMATYNWDIGTIQRPTAQPKKFEVPSHQWIDLTDMSGKFGATILTDCKNGSDKPNDTRSG